MSCETRASPSSTASFGVNTNTLVSTQQPSDFRPVRPQQVDSGTAPEPRPSSSKPASLKVDIRRLLSLKKNLWDGPSPSLIVTIPGQWMNVGRTGHRNVTTLARIPMPTMTSLRCFLTFHPPITVQCPQDKTSSHLGSSRQTFTHADVRGSVSDSDNQYIPAYVSAPRASSRWQPAGNPLDSANRYKLRHTLCGFLQPC